MMLTHWRSTSPRRVRKVRGNHTHICIAGAMTDAIALEANQHLIVLGTGIDWPTLSVGQARFHIFEASCAFGVEKVFCDL